MRKNVTFLFYLSSLLTALLWQATLSAQPIQTFPVASGQAGVPQTAAQMIQGLFGGGIVVSNITINCDTTVGQMGWFLGPGQSFNLGSGLLLTSGVVANAVGPNLVNGISTPLGTPGDPQLDILSGQITFDACGIEFDILPLCDTIGIRYVFGSDEYMTFVGSINDAFGFFLSGPNPAGGAYVNQNIAVLPGSGTPVSINNVNCATNAPFYICNDVSDAGACPGGNCPPNNATTSLEYDGITVTLDALASVVPCQSYHVKLVVADGSDDALDSGVFLQAGGVSCVGTIPPTIVAGNVSNPGSSDAQEGCSDVVIVFTNNDDTTQALTIAYTLSGTATNGVDYSLIPATGVTIPAGQSSTSITISPILDALPEGVETIQLITAFSACGSTISDTVNINIFDPFTINAGLDVTTCSGQITGMGNFGVPGIQYSWSPSTGLNNPNIAQPGVTITLPAGTTTNFTQNYVLTATNALGCVDTDTLQVTVIPRPIVSISMTDTACAGAVIPVAYTGFPAFGPTGVTNLAWTFNTASGGIQGQPNQNLTWLATGTQTINLTATNSAGCVSTPFSQNIFITPVPTSSFSIPASTCLGQPVVVNYTGTANSTASFNWTFGGATAVGSGVGPYILSFPQAGTYTITLQVNQNGCISNVTTQQIIVYDYPTANFAFPSNICIGALNTVIYTGNAAPNAQYLWNFGDAIVTSGAGPGPYTLSWTTPSSQGAHIICLSVIENGCASPENCDTVHVLDQPVAAIAPVNDQCFINNNFTFTYAGTTASAYTWNFGNGANPPTALNVQNPSGITYSNPGPKVVTLVVEENGCLSDTATVGFNVHIEPSANFSYNSATSCLGGCITFTYTGIPLSNQQVYNWNFGPNANPQFSTLVNPGCVQFNNPGFHPVTLTTSHNGCVTAFTQNVYVSPGPQVSAGVDKSYCEGSGPVELDGFVVPGTGVAPYTFSWSCNSPLVCGIDSVNAMTPQVNPGNSPTTYYFQVMDNLGCISTIDSMIVTILPKPKADAGPDKAMCEGAFGVILQGGVAANNLAPGPFTYSWFPTTGIAPGQDTIQSPYVTPSQTTIYTLVLTSANGCSSDVTTLDTISTVTVTVNPIPSVEAGPYKEICFGDTYQMQGYAFPCNSCQYNWTPVSANAGIAAPNNPITNVTPLYTQTYTLSANNKGCIASDTVTIHVNVLPTASIESPATNICQGDTVQLNGLADGDPFGNVYIYSWVPLTNPSSISSTSSPTPLVFPSTTTTYQLYAGTAECIGFVDDITVVVKSSPIALVTTADTLICGGDSVHLNVNFSFNGTPAGTPILYNWTPASSLSASNIANPWASPTVTTTYTATVSIGGDCPSHDEVTIVVSPNLNISASAAPEIICGEGETILSASGGFGNASYQWTPSYGLSDSTIANPTASPDTTTTYILTMTEGSCMDRDTITITVNPQPIAGAYATHIRGCAPLEVAFFENAEDELSYVWNFGDGTAVSNEEDPMHTYVTPGTYTATLTVKGINGCVSTASVGPIVVNDTSFASFTSTPPIDSAILLPSGEIHFFDTSPNSVNWYWNFGDGNIATEQNPIHHYLLPGIYTVSLSVTNTDGCVSHISQTPYTVLEPGLLIPNIFTPNGDGIHDTWNIHYNGTESFQLGVYDRWGINVFNSETPASTWNGMSEDKGVSDGVYFWSLKIGKKVYSGNVTLIR